MRTVNPLVPTQPVVGGLCQGKGRGRRAGRATLDPGTAAQSAVLLAGRVEPGDPRTGGSTERPADARLGHHATRLVRATRPPGAAIPAANTLRIRRLEALSGQPRLPHRDRKAFLLGAVPAAAPGSGGADHGKDGGDLSPRQAGGDTPAQPASVSTHHGGRAHAELASALSRL